MHQDVYTVADKDGKEVIVQEEVDYKDLFHSHLTKYETLQQEYEVLKKKKDNLSEAADKVVSRVRAEFSNVLATIPYEILEQSFVELMKSRGEMGLVNFYPEEDGWYLNGVQTFNHMMSTRNTQRFKSGPYPTLKDTIISYMTHFGLDENQRAETSGRLANLMDQIAR